MLSTRILILILLALTLPGALAMTATAEPHPATQPATAPAHTNRLAGETSPYLLQHAHNPVDWYPWGEEAFEEARREQKPIFLSVGYSTCYWCHVMEREVFENEVIAARMNELFVNIKVDREERPDVDDVYMTATQLMTGQGGWPMSVFLTPPAPHDTLDPAAVNEAAGVNPPAPAPPAAGYGLKPFWAGTYLPPEPMMGRPGFPQVLQGLSDAWKNQRADVLKQAQTVADAVAEQVGSSHQEGDLSPRLVSRTAEALLRRYDPEHGGFTGPQGPKFPSPANLLFLLRAAEHTDNADIADAVHHTLDRMARGGMYDQVGGGFHRYSVDEKWLVPHFEKMLYDNGQLLEVYAAALESLRREHGDTGETPVPPNEEDQRLMQLYEYVLRGTADYVLREMTDETGAFHTAQDAEVDGREGDNYLWTPTQIRQAIADQDLAKRAIHMYGLDLGTNFQDPHHPEADPANVLYLPASLEQLAEEERIPLDALTQKRDAINAALKAARDRRKQPRLDDKVLAGWNGMMIRGLAEAGRVLDEPQYTNAAARAADAVADHMTVADPDHPGLYRAMRKGESKVDGFLEDYAFMVSGLTALSRAEAERGETIKAERYLKLARRYTDIAVDRFAAEGGGYYDTLAGQSDLFVRTRGLYDGAIPSGNSQMVHNLITLGEMTGQPGYTDRAVVDLRSFAGAMMQMGPGMVHMQGALLQLMEAAPAMVEGAATQPAIPPATQPAAGEAAAPVTAAVDADSLTLEDSTARFDLVIRIAEAYHINANPASDELLLPTEVMLAEDSPLDIEVSYPEGREEHYPFASGPLRVYEGVVRLPVTLRVRDAAALPERATLRVRVQACTETACLIPQTLEVGVELR